MLACGADVFSAVASLSRRREATGRKYVCVRRLEVCVSVDKKTK